MKRLRDIVQDQFKEKGSKVNLLTFNKIGKTIIEIPEFDSYLLDINGNLLKKIKINPQIAADLFKECKNEYGKHAKLYFTRRLEEVLA